MFFLKSAKYELNILDSIDDIPDLTLREQYEFARAPVCVKSGVLNDLIKNKKSKDEGELKIKNSIMSIYYDIVFQYARNRKYHKSSIELPQHYRLDHQMFEDNNLDDMFDVSDVCEIYLRLSKVYPEKFSETELCQQLISKSLSNINDILLK